MTEPAFVHHADGRITEHDIDEAAAVFITIVLPLNTERVFYRATIAPPAIGPVERPRFFESTHPALARITAQEFYSTRGRR